MGFFDRVFATKATTDPPSGEAGRDGVAASELELGGPDVNPLLSGTAKWPVYDEMRSSDAQVRATLWKMKLPIVGAQWSVEPASDSPEDVEIAEALEAQFGLGRYDSGWLNVSWRDSLQQAMLYLDYGCMFEEIVWGDVIDWTSREGGTTRKIRPIRKLGPRKPATIADIQADAEGNLASLLQDLDGASKIPGEKIVWYVNEREDGHWWGVSLLRAMWPGWMLKKSLLQTSGIAYERYSAGVPVVRYPESGGPAVKAKADAIGYNYRTHQRGWISLPGQPPPNGDWDVQIVGGASTIADPISLLNYYNQEIAAAALQEFSKLGTTETGSRAVGEVLADPFYLAVQAHAAYVSEQRQKMVVRPWVDVNFGAEYDTPNLLVPKIDADNTAAVIEAIERLNGAGWQWNDREIQDLMRQRLGLPEMPEDAPLEAEGADLATDEALGADTPDETAEGA
jgi:hypothetical protein